MKKMKTLKKNSKDLKQGYHIVFLWNKKVPIEQLDFHIISQDMKFIFSKAGILL